MSYFPVQEFGLWFRAQLLDGNYVTLEHAELTRLDRTTHRVDCYLSDQTMQSYFLIDNNLRSQDEYSVQRAFFDMARIMTESVAFAEMEQRQGAVN